MNAASSKGTPPVLERHELKYVVPFEMVEPMSQFVEPYCQLDKYSEREPDHFYRVNSLYFDTPSLLFMRKRIEHCENRFNMRIRSYGDAPDFPYFLEVKQKKGNLIRKFRGRVHEGDWTRLLHSPHDLHHGNAADKEGNNRNIFVRLLQVYGAVPQILTRYRRKAYMGITEEYARVTFDIRLECCLEENYNLTPDPARMQPYDYPIVVESPTNVVLELKCYTTQVPLWMVDLIRHFQLRRRSFSKYANSMRQALSAVQYDSGERVTTFAELERDAALSEAILP